MILAAGSGRRLEGRTSGPKILLRFGGRSLLERHIEALRAHGISDIAITIGYEGDMIRGALAQIEGGDDIHLIDNPRFREGSVVSLACQAGRLEAGQPVILMDGDVLYDARMIARLLTTPRENVLLMDRAIEPGDEPVKICLRGETIVDLAKRPTVPYDRHGESVGFFRFSPVMAAEVARRAGAAATIRPTDAEYEAVLRDLILAMPERFGYADISDLPWTEIDFGGDVERAEREILPLLESETR